MREILITVAKDEVMADDIRALVFKITVSLFASTTR